MPVFLIWLLHDATGRCLVCSMQDSALAWQTTLMLGHVVILGIICKLRQLESFRLA